MVGFGLELRVRVGVGARVSIVTKRRTSWYMRAHERMSTPRRGLSSSIAKRRVQQTSAPSASAAREYHSSCSPPDSSSALSPWPSTDEARLRAKASR